MRLNAPTKIMFWITVILAIVAAVFYIVGFFLLPALAIVGFGLLAIAFILLVLAVILENV